MPTLNHIHQFKRLRKGLYKCDDPYCTFTAEVKLIRDKASKCNACGKEMILTREILRLAIPKCDDCRDTKDTRMKKAAKELLENLGIRG